MLAPSFLGMLAALGSSAAWAVGAILFRGLGKELSPLAMTIGKALIAIVLLSVTVLCVGPAPISGREVAYLCLSGIIGIAVGDVFFFAALRDLRAHVVVALMLLSPVLTIALAVLLFGERPSPACWLGITLCLGGVGTVMWIDSPSEEEGHTRTRGVLFGLGAVVCMTAATLISAVALRETPALDATWIRMIAGAAGLVLFGLVTGRTRVWAGELRHFRLGLRLLAATAVVTFGGFWLSLVALRYTSVTIANTLNSLEALFILPIAALFLGEKPRWPAVAGAVVACAGTSLIILYRG